MTTPPATNPPSNTARPDLVLTSFSTDNNLDWGQSFRARGTVINDGPGTAPAGVEVDIYASATPGSSANALFVGTVKLDQAIAPGGGSQL